MSNFETNADVNHSDVPRLSGNSQEVLILGCIHGYQWENWNQNPTLVYLKSENLAVRKTPSVLVVHFKKFFFFQNNVFQKTNSISIVWFFLLDVLNQVYFLKQKINFELFNFQLLFFFKKNAPISNIFLLAFCLERIVISINCNLSQFFFAHSILLFDILYMMTWKY